MIVAILIVNAISREERQTTACSDLLYLPWNNRIYDGVEAETRISPASFQII